MPFTCCDAATAAGMQTAEGRLWSDATAPRSAAPAPAPWPLPVLCSSSSFSSAHDNGAVSAPLGLLAMAAQVGAAEGAVTGADTPLPASTTPWLMLEALRFVGELLAVLRGVNAGASTLNFIVKPPVPFEVLPKGASALPAAPICEALAEALAAVSEDTHVPFFMSMWPDVETLLPLSRSTSSRPSWRDASSTALEASLSAAAAAAAASAASDDRAFVRLDGLFAILAAPGRTLSGAAAPADDRDAELSVPPAATRAGPGVRSWAEEDAFDADGAAS